MKNQVCAVLLLSALFSPRTMCSGDDEESKIIKNAIDAAKHFAHIASKHAEEAERNAEKAKIQAQIAHKHAEFALQTAQRAHEAPQANAAKCK